MNTRYLHSDRAITTEANGLVFNDRNKAYGHPLTDYETTAKLWSAILGTDITPYQACLCMIAMKLSRAARSTRRDNLVDIAGYAEVANEIVLTQFDEKLDYTEVLNAHPPF